ncbi:MAG: hypothetical protein RIR73_778, partial [Chloroflexota bacterium]
ISTKIKNYFYELRNELVYYGGSNFAHRVWMLLWLIDRFLQMTLDVLTWRYEQGQAVVDIFICVYYCADGWLCIFSADRRAGTKQGSVALLFRDIPDKKYSWQDFVDRGAKEGISGFYAYGDAKSFSMWTLSGLKTFTHVADISVYQHEDVCFAMRQLANDPQGRDKPAKADQTITGKIEVWQNLVKQENLVTVLRLPEDEYHNGIDKVWSYSGRYKKLNILDEDTCE